MNVWEEEKKDRKKDGDRRRGSNLQTRQLQPREQQQNNTQVESAIHTKNKRGRLKKKTVVRTSPSKTTATTATTGTTEEQKNKRTSKQVRGRRQDRIVTKQARERQKRNKGKQNRVTVESKR